MGDTYYYTKTEVEYAIKNPAIIHIIWVKNPWRRGNKHKFKFNMKIFIHDTME